jgi:predicted RNA-binding Zn ribbon-like protein
VTFTHDAELALRGAEALANTPDDELRTPSDLRAHLEEWEWTGVGELGDDDVADALRLRDRLVRLWSLDLDPLVEEVNAMLREAGALPQLVAHDSWGYHLHATTDDAGLGDRLVAETAMAFLDLVRQEQLDRLGICAATGCDGVLVDLTRNRSRRFCSTRCGNRTHVAAYRRREDEDRG